MPRRVRKRGNSSDRIVRRAPAREIPPSSEIEGLLDEVKATTIVLLASLQEKERELRNRPAPGATRGLSDIRALRRWADRMLRTIGVLEHGRSGELEALLEELEEFREILNQRQPPISAEPTPVPGSRP